MDLKILDKFEVYSQKTTEYTIELAQKTHTIRISEDSNGIEYLILNNTWETLEEDSHGEEGNTILELILDGCIK